MPRGKPRDKFPGMYRKDTVNHGRSKREFFKMKTNKKPVRAKVNVRQHSLFEENIRFKMPLELFVYSSRKDEYFQLLKEAFGIQRDQIDTSYLDPYRPMNHGPRGIHFVDLEVSPSQFTYFLIRRDQMGLTNSFKELEAHYVGTPVPARRDNKFKVA